MKIHVLDNSMINQIAAGEVVERPASVVKELVENAIDAKAASITVEIKDGGISYIRISDNGIGIPKEDVKSAFLRHATSKVSTMEDIANVLTLGFRGEALSSIASVAQVEMTTKTRNEPTGTKIEIQGGQIISFSDTGCTEGTTIIIRNLFFNTPARRKFLKKPQTEGGAVSELMQRLALAHPEVAFNFVQNSVKVLSTNGNNDLKTAAFYVYGKEISSKLLPVDYTRDKITFKGYVCKPDTARGNRSYGNFFINGRYIKSGVIQRSIEEAYRTRLPIGKFPVYIIHMEMPANTVDVNVHPTKLDVRFENEEYIYELVKTAVEKAFEDENLVAVVSWDPEKKRSSSTLVFSERDTDIIEEDKCSIGEKLAGKLYADKSAKSIEAPSFVEESLVEFIAPEEQPKEQALPSQPRQISVVQDSVIQDSVAEEKNEEESIRDFFADGIIVGQIFNTYWVLEHKNKMYLVDQHAAHERVLYEEYINKFREGSIVKQMLVEPISVKVMEAERDIINENMELFSGLGFDIEQLGTDTVLIRTVPYIFLSPAPASLFTEILDKLSSIGGLGSVKNLYDLKLHAISTISCKAAVKGNDRLSNDNAKELLSKMSALDNPFTCPHGRPTIISMTKYEIEKKFKRV